MKLFKSKKLYIFTLLFFLLGIFNIVFALAGILCIVLPFILLSKFKKKLWCQGYCPRSSLLENASFKSAKKSKRAPSWMIDADARFIVLTYFFTNLFVVIMSTIMVFSGRILPMETLRFLIVFQLPLKLPQLIDIFNLPQWIIHLSYRVYSMFMTTTVIGILLGFFYKPKTWCAICPINTLSNRVLKNNN